MVKRDQIRIKALVFSLAIIIMHGTTSYITGATKATWPKVMKNAKGELTIYQPQPESLNETLLSGRAAISVKLTDAKRPVFGAIWITSTLVVDRNTRIATFTDVKVPTIRFSDDVDSARIGKLRKLIEDEIPKWNLEISIDELITTLDASSNNAGDQFKNDPPEIIIAKTSSILVLIDGEPILKELEGYNYKRIENSAFFIILDPKAKTYYLYGDKLWYSATDIKGKWSQVKKPSSNLTKLQREIEKSQGDQTSDPSSKSKNATVVIPAVIVRTIPAELIEIKGEPDFAPIQGTNLLYVKNSDDNVFMDINIQSYLILISGRWYSSVSMDGPWAYINVEDLPEDFARIPEGSEKDIVLASVSGTQASKEAILDSQIPQTAEIDRKTATVTVEYDGEPKFEKVEGTSMLYAVNSPQTVLQLSSRYYCVDNGVWFEAGNPKGPWKAAEQRPEEVENIKPSSPVYNVKYVYIYDVSPTVIYVGYTPGYYGCYVHGPTVIYGTGYYYRPWYGAYYYPRPVTYGFRMSYNPWTGWGMSVGVSYGGWFHMSYRGGYRGGYWGPPAYRPPYHRHPSRGGYYGGRRPAHYSTTNVNINKNIYANNRRGVKPTVSRPSNRPAASNRNVSSNNRQNNNIYTDKSGKVYQKTNKGWETRKGNDWKPVDSKKPSTGAVTRPSKGTAGRPSTGTAAPSSFDRSSMNKASQSRDRGAVRTNNYNNYSRGGKAASRPAPTRNTRGAAAGRRR